MTREEALKSFEEENKDFEKTFERYGYQMSTEEVSAVKEAIERNKVAISALSENKGEWIHDGSHWENRFNCSKCGYKLFEEPTNFCPCCGADMRGDKAE